MRGEVKMATITERLKGQSDRLVILAACGFVRTIEHLLLDERSRQGIEVAERFADGLVQWAEANRAWENSFGVFYQRIEHLGTTEDPSDAIRDAVFAVLRAEDAQAAEDAIKAATALGVAEDAMRTALALGAAEDAIRTATSLAKWSAAARAAMRAAVAAPVETTHQAILDCLLPPRIQFPFPVHVKELAATIYQKRDWSLMPILADALEELGQAEMATHCRQPIHAKGCYALDSISESG
jgi:hypothetical protein